MDAQWTLANMDLFVFTILTTCTTNNYIFTSHTVPSDGLASFFVYYTDVVPVVFHPEFGNLL